LVVVHVVWVVGVCIPLLLLEFVVWFSTLLLLFCLLENEEYEFRLLLVRTRRALLFAAFSDSPAPGKPDKQPVTPVVLDSRAGGALCDVPIPGVGTELVQ
jgi:hypothetical protein